MKCPKCGIKYNKDINVCTNCGAKLPDNEKEEIYVTDEMLNMLGIKTEKKKEPVIEKPIKDYEIVFNTINEMEANLIKSMLEKEGVNCAFLSDNPCKAIIRCSGELTLIVSKTDYNVARDIVKAYINSLDEPTEITDLMWDDKNNEFDIDKR